MAFVSIFTLLFAGFAAGYSFRILLDRAREHRAMPYSYSDGNGTTVRSSQQQYVDQMQAVLDERARSAAQEPRGDAVKRLITVIIVALVLTACGERVGYEQHRTPDGRNVECFVYHVGYKGGISCNWPGAK